MGQRKLETSANQEFNKISEHQIDIGSNLERFETSEKSSTNQFEKSQTTQIREKRENFARRSRNSFERKSFDKKSYERKSYAERSLALKENRYSLANKQQQNIVQEVQEPIPQHKG
jgi:hypothetical protein